jgi:hypothetical protein
MFRAVFKSRVPSVPVKKNLLYRVIAIRPHTCTFTSTCIMPSKKDDKYTDPELREEVKEEIQAGDKGGAPGQSTWPHHILTSTLTDTYEGTNDGFGV